MKQRVISRILNAVSFLLVLLCSLFLSANSTLALETTVQIFTLSGNNPYINTGITINPGDSLTIRQEGSGAIYPPGRTVPWVSHIGDPGCIAGPDFTLSGVNCWNLVARIGGGAVFSALNYSSQPSDTGTLYLGINHAPPKSTIGSGSWRVRVIHNYNPPPPPEPTPNPFLDLPWNYSGEGGTNMTFSEAALSINAYFDHEYPLLSVIDEDFPEPEIGSGTVITYLSNNRGDESYPSHDGYDYGGPAKTKLNTPILAPASGCASFHHDNAIGNAIFIDHHNFYQTRYYHMMDKDLITRSANSCVEVSKGQMIGRVGATGHIEPDLKEDPTGFKGSHLHFMVIEDKNQDGNFADNIPDGITDPFGWKSSEPDPWENYTFEYNGQQRTGNDSHYLWIHPTSIPKWTLTPVGGSTSLENDIIINFPAGATTEDIVVELQKTPMIRPSENQVSIGASIEIVARNLFNSLITQFQQAFTLTFDFSNKDITLFDPDSLTIYSSSDGETWVPEETQIDWQEQTATAQIDHLTYFALVGTLLDTIAPNTEMLINGVGETGGAYPAPTEISLNATDDQAGLGVDYTLYRINDSDWQVYETPFSLETVGDYTIHYYSVDLSENVEAEQSISFSIVEQAPELILKLNLDTKQPELVASGSGEIQSTTSNVNWLTKQTVFTDSASQTITVVYRMYKLFGTYFTHLQTIQYNQDEAIELPENSHTTYVSRGSNPVISQSSWIKDQQLTASVYNPNKDHTLVYTHPEEGEDALDVLPGPIILQLSSDEGNLVISY